MASWKGRSGRMLVPIARANEYNAVGEKVAKLRMIGYGRNVAPVLVHIDIWSDGLGCQETI